MDDSRAQVGPSLTLRAAARQTLGWFASPKLAVMLIVGIAAVLAAGHGPRIRQRTRVRPVVRLQEPLVHGAAWPAGTEHSGRHDGPLSLAAGASRILADPCRAVGALGRRDSHLRRPASRANSPWKKANRAIRSL